MKNGGKSEGNRREDVSCIYQKSHTKGSRREAEESRREVGLKVFTVTEGSRREDLSMLPIHKAEGRQR